MLSICYSHIHSSYSSLKYPHIWDLSTYVYTGRRVEELCACIWFCECINNELDVSSSWMTHDCSMIVYHVFRLVILEGWYVLHESRLVSILSWRLCCVVHGFRLMFSRLCWMACNSFMSTLKCRKTPSALMKHNMRQLLEEQKDFAVIIFSLVSICFQDWWFF